MTIAISVMYGLAMFVFVVIFFANWYRSRKQVSYFKGFGYSMGGILVGLELFMLFLLVANRVKVPSFFSILIIDTIAFFRIAAFTIMGIHYCAIIGLASFPLLMQKYGNPKPPLVKLNPPSEQVLEESLEQTMPETNMNDAPIDDTHPGIVLPIIDMKRYITAVTAVAAGGVIFSTVLFLTTSPQPSEIVRQYFGLNLDSTLANQVNFLTVMMVLTYAFAEEIIFRLGIQNYLAQKFGWLGDKYWVAILITTALWTMGHVGVLDPNWVKFVQVFPFGVALGWLFKRYGVESTIIAHGVFNVVLLIPSQYLINF